MATYRELTAVMPHQCLPRRDAFREAVSRAAATAESVAFADPSELDRIIGEDSTRIGETFGLTTGQVEEDIRFILDQRGVKSG